MTLPTEVNPLLRSQGGYQISRSVRLRSSATAYLDRTMTSSFTSQRIFTFSFWLKRGTLSTAQSIFDRNQSTNVNQFAVGFNTDNTFAIVARTSGTSTISLNLTTSAVFRDPSAWYHFVIAVDNTQATLANRGQIYVNGVLQTLGTQTATQNVDYRLLTGLTYDIGRTALTASQYFDGYLTEFNFIDGQQLTPASFGETNSVTGVWQPKKYTGTYGTNGFYLNFSDNSAATAAAIGKDNSGNGNNWTPNNISVTAGVTYDSMLDVPTQWADGGNGRGNYCTGNPLIMYNGGGGAAIIPKNGNLDLIGGAGWAMVGSTIAVSTGKWYWEATFFKPGSGDGVLGIHKSNTSLFQIVGYSGDPNGYGYAANGNKQNNSTGVAYGASYTNGDVIGVALDLDAGTLTFYKNNTSQGVAFSSLSGEFFPAFSSEIAYFQANFGQRPFAYTPPTGFKALNTLNLPTPTILKGNQYFDATTYTGTGATLSVTNSGSMQPDLVWIKQRSAIRDHRLHDSVRGVSKQLFSSTTGAETSNTDELTAFNSNGFTLSTSAGVNASAGTYVGWQWKEGATQGFDIVTYTGTGANATVGHGLGVAPSMMIVKNRTTAGNWPVYHSSIGATNAVFLNVTNASTASSTTWNSTAPTSSVFSVGTSSLVNSSGDNYVAYLFAEVAGFSKFGSYTGNGTADGPFVYLGFRPKFVMWKRTDVAGAWYVINTTTSSYNEVTLALSLNTSAAEVTEISMDALSNGFKIRRAQGAAAFGTGTNTVGGTYIFAAFAEHPLKFSLAR